MNHYKLLTETLNRKMTLSNDYSFGIPEILEVSHINVVNLAIPHSSFVIGNSPVIRNS